MNTTMTITDVNTLINANFNIVNGIIKTKADIVKVLDEAHIKYNRKANKSEILDVFFAAVDEAIKIKKAEATNKEDIMNTEAIKAEVEVKVIDSNEAHVEAEAHVTSLEAEEAIIAEEGDCIASSTKRRAEAFYRIATMKLYEVLKDEDGNICKSFKSYVNDFRGGEVKGVKYSTAMNYVNCVKYVYPQCKDFEFWGSHLLFALIKPLRNEETRGKILEAIKSDVLNRHMKEAEFKTTIKDILGEAEVKEGEAEEANEYATSNTCEVSEEALDEAVNEMEEYLANNAHDSKVTHAWYIILKALDR